MRVVFAPEVEEDLYGLIKILVEKEYLGTYPFAISYAVSYTHLTLPTNREV